MRNMAKTSFIVFLLAASLTGCAKKETGKSVTNNYVTNNPITGGGTITPGTGGGSTAISGCSDGVYRDGATSCYYSNLPTMVFSGSGVAGYHYWSSAINLPADIDPGQFRTDASFAVRIKPVIVDGGTSFQGRSCSQYTKNNFSKLQVKLMLSRTSDNGLSSNIKTLTASVGTYSNTARFTVPGGTADPYVLSVYSVLSNHRCNAAYGSAPTGCPNAYFDIPLVTTTSAPTECVGFELEFATDNTYDLPN